jgi:PilZ domain-containing protein
VSYAQLAILPVIDGRSAERRIVNLAARLREPGARIVDADVLNLSTDGFMASVEIPLEVGANVWLKLSGLEPQNSRVVWIEDGKAGFQFAAPLHPATLELIVENGRKAPPKKHFGPQAQPHR